MSFVTSIHYTTVITGLLSCFLLYVFGPKLRGRRIPKGLKLPPGPPRKFLIGNLTDMPHYRQWETFKRWHEMYGGIVYLNILGQSIVFLNSSKLTNELLEKRSLIYSDRPHFVMLGDLVRFDWIPTLMSYGERFRRHRQVLYQSLTSSFLNRYKSIQTKHARTLLYQMLSEPEEFLSHLRYVTGAVTMEITYGINVKSKDDPYIRTAEIVLGAAGETAAPGAFLVDIFPFMKYIPEWIPGATFQKKAKFWRHHSMKMNYEPFEIAKKAFESGNVQPSMTALLLEELSTRQDAPPDEEEIIRNCASSMYAGGTDTTTSVLHVFMLAMTLFPLAQQKAHEELDRVVGPDRLPEFTDMPSLPYLSAVCKEALRWHVIAPTAAPHVLKEDDVVGEYFIPAGTWVLGNSWEVLHEEETYGPDTETFNPERFLQPGVKDPVAAFGYGRRICPGRTLSENMLFITISSLLHAFTISSIPGAVPDLKANETFTTGIFSRPTPFRCSIVPRSEKLAMLVDKPDCFDPPFGLGISESMYEG